MSNEHTISRRTSVAIPNAPPLPAPLPAARPLQRARDAAYRFIGYPPQPTSTNGEARAWISGRHAILGATENATASHKTGLEINTIAVNESGTHALLGGKEIFKTVKVENGHCVEEQNLRTAIRSTPNQASGKPRQSYSIDIADVAWAKGSSGNYVAAATSSGKIVLYDIGHAGIQAAQLHEHFRQVHKVTFNPHSGNLLLSGSQDGTVRLWDIRDARDTANTLHSKRKYSGQSDGVRDVKWSPTDGMDFAFGTDSGWVQRWDIRNLKSAKVKIAAHALSCNIIDWHPDGSHLASGSSDKTIRVWDVSGSRKGKASWEVKTPYPVMNARWRPACESSMPADNGAKQCTQIVTGYDREHPVLHLWDLRRPALPFREMVPYASAPTDLTWHSTDTLWTVGREGVFLQSDIQHAPKTMDNRNLQSFAVSPTGELLAFVQRRQQRRSPKRHHSRDNENGTVPSTLRNNLDITRANTGASSKYDAAETTTPIISRGWQDDSLDHSFLSMRPASSRSNSGTKTPSGGHNIPILGLGQILHNRKSFSPQQVAIRGMLPYHVHPDVFRFLASNYTHFSHLAATADQNILDKVLEGLERNHDVAEKAGLYKLAQSWKIIRFVALNHMETRCRSIPAMLNVVGAPTFGGDAVSRVIHRGDAGNTGSKILRGDSISPQCHIEHEPVHSHEDGDPPPDNTESPFDLPKLLKEMLQYHCAKGDAQTATHLLLHLVPLLPATAPLSNDEAERNMSMYPDALSEAGCLERDIPDIIEKHLGHLVLKGLHPFQVESILCTYHEQLLRHRLFVEACALRKICYPAFPSVYEDFMVDNHLALSCSKCGKPMESDAAKDKCASCKTKMEPCQYCWESASPFGMGVLMTACLKCNHSMHSGCSEEWFEKEGGDGCATEGCLCNCVEKG
ncbi:SEA (Seh1-associated) complex subunit [Elasticomyces elasticus]|nr:SEA (Seh1-associated) complex subunit [Elasticomyces elasticus]